MSGLWSAMTLPFAMSVCSSCWETLKFVSGSSVPPCCGQGAEHPLTCLAILALGRQWFSVNKLSFYCYCNNYSYCGELQYQLMVIKLYLQLLSWAVPYIYSMQWLCLCHSSTSDVPLIRDHWSDLLPPTLCGHWNNVFHVFGSDKLDYYIHSLRS